VIRFQLPLLLASTEMDEMIRPVFLLVMGVLLVVFAWRIAKSASACNARLIVVGGLMLGFGYAVLLPILETAEIMAHAAPARSHAVTAETYGWHTVVLVVMNGGWLLFGIGMALHAKIWRVPGTRGKTSLHHCS